MTSIPRNTTWGTAAETIEQLIEGAVPGDATTSAKGVVELATTGETQAGTDSTRAVTPAGVKAVADTKVPKVGTSLSNSGTDLNTLAPGIYYQNSNVNADTNLNYPAPIAGTLYQLSWGNGMIQLYFPYTANATYGRKIYMRSRASTTWQPWLEILTKTESDNLYAPQPPGGDSYVLASEMPTVGSGVLGDEVLPTAAPTEAELVPGSATGLSFQPVSRGVDGYVYFKTSSGRLYRSNDGLDSYTQCAHNFTKDILWAGRTREGYTAIVPTGTPGATEIWHCPGSDWDTGWTKVQDIGYVGLLSAPRPAQRRGAGTVLLVPEYTATSPGTSMKLWLSLDGGATWTDIRDSQVIDGGVNAHWHGAIFDPARERIWASQGDGANSWFGYSDDLGNTWVDAPTPSGSPVADAGSDFQQPTVLVNFGDYVGLAPDRGPFLPGMWQMDAETGQTVIRAEIEALSGVVAHEQFGIGGFYAQQGKEAYVAFPDTGSGNRTTYVMATGDGGRSWHVVLEFDWGGSGSWSTGIVGPDASGHLYFKKSNEGVRVVPKLSWEWTG